MQVSNLYEIKELDSNGLIAVDLFCGAGVGAYGIKKAGYDIVFGVDNDSQAVMTYNLNIGNHAICEDIRNITKDNIPEHDLMIATPVCKPFSMAGARKLTNDEKFGDLLSETIRLFSECKPKALFFENVEGLVMGESIYIFNDFVNLIEALGYLVYWDVVNCWDLGVPQERKRVLLVAIRDDIEFEFISPKKLTYGKKTQRDAIYDLKDKPNMFLKNHNTDYHGTWSVKFETNNRQSDWDEPACTVISKSTASAYYPEPKIYEYRKEDRHKYPRRLSVRENLRLQTVGDDFYFPSNMSMSKQYERCSGVPSLVAYKYGIAIADCLLGKTNKLNKKIKKKKLF